MDQQVKLETGRWLRRRDAWMRSLVGNEFVSRNGKLVGFHLALRLSAKKPYCYPAMKSIAKALGISPRHVARALKEVTKCDKLNIAALGNVVPQLHVHVIARFRSDAAWPKPVWGVAPPRPYDREELHHFGQPLRKKIWLE